MVGPNNTGEGPAGNVETGGFKPPYEKPSDPKWPGGAPHCEPGTGFGMSGGFGGAKPN